jgi:hypothetical protein
MNVLFKNHNYKKLLNFSILLLIFPFPGFLGDFLSTQLLLLFILFFSIKPIYKNYLNKKILTPILIQYIVTLMTLTLNIGIISNYYDVSTELFRYILYFIIINNIWYHLLDLPKHKIVMYSQNVLIVLMSIQYINLT